MNFNLLHFLSVSRLVEMIEHLRSGGMSVTDDGNSSGAPALSQWEGLYKAAVLETDLAKLSERILAAEAAIGHRQRMLSNTADHVAELRAMEDAIALLRVLKREAASGP